MTVAPMHSLKSMETADVLRHRSAAKQLRGMVAASANNVQRLKMGQSLVDVAREHDVVDGVGPAAVASDDFATTPNSKKAGSDTMTHRKHHRAGTMRSLTGSYSAGAQSLIKALDESMTTGMLSVGGSATSPPVRDDVLNKSAKSVAGWMADAWRDERAPDGDDNNGSDFATEGRASSAPPMSRRTMRWKKQQRATAAEKGGSAQAGGGLASTTRRPRTQEAALDRVASLVPKKKHREPDRVMCKRGAPVYYGSSVSLCAPHGGFLTLDADGAVSAASRKPTPRATFVIWNLSNLTDVGLVRYGDRVWLQASRYEVLGSSALPTDKSAEWTQTVDDSANALVYRSQAAQSSSSPSSSRNHLPNDSHAIQDPDWDAFAKRAERERKVTKNEMALLGTSRFDSADQTMSRARANPLERGKQDHLAKRKQQHSSAGARDATTSDATTGAFLTTKKNPTLSSSSSSSTEGPATKAKTSLSSTTTTTTTTTTKGAATRKMMMMHSVGGTATTKREKKGAAQDESKLRRESVGRLCAVRCSGRGLERARQVGRWVLVSKASPFGKMGEAVCHLDDIALQQDWLFVASTVPETAELRTNAADTAGVSETLEYTHDKAMDRRPDRDRQKLLFHQAAASSAAAAGTTTTTTTTTTQQQRPPPQQASSRRRAVFHATEFERDFVWTLHVVNLPSNSGDELQRAIRAQRARKHLEASAKAYVTSANVLLRSRLEAQLEGGLATTQALEATWRRRDDDLATYMERKYLDRSKLGWTAPPSLTTLLDPSLSRFFAAERTTDAAAWAPVMLDRYKLEGGGFTDHSRTGASGLGGTTPPPTTTMKDSLFASPKKTALDGAHQTYVDEVEFREEMLRAFTNGPPEAAEFYIVRYRAAERIQEWFRKSKIRVWDASLGKEDAGLLRQLKRQDEPEGTEEAEEEKSPDHRWKSRNNASSPTTRALLDSNTRRQRPSSSAKLREAIARDFLHQQRALRSATAPAMHHHHHHDGPGGGQATTSVVCTTFSADASLLRSSPVRSVRHGGDDDSVVRLLLLGSPVRHARTTRREVSHRPGGMTSTPPDRPVAAEGPRPQEAVTYEAPTKKTPSLSGTTRAELTSNVSNRRFSQRGLSPFATLTDFSSSRTLAALDDEAIAAKEAAEDQAKNQRETDAEDRLIRSFRADYDAKRGKLPRSGSR